MHIDPTTENLGKKWLIFAGGFAILLSYTLFSVDNNLAASKSEKIHAEKLTELRTAQVSLGSRASDQRQTQESIIKLRAVPANPDPSVDDHGTEEHH